MTRSQYQTLIDTLADNQPNTAATVRGILGALADGATFTNEMKLMDTTNVYIAANFDGTGLGINEMLGYAIANGQNGTRDWGGRVPVGYDASLYPTLGFAGGTKEVTLTTNQIPPLNVPFTGSNADNGDSGSLIITSNTQSNGARNLTTAGGGQPHDNMQPYRVILYVMKL